MSMISANPCFKIGMIIKKRTQNRKHIRQHSLSESEIITIMLLFHLSHYRNFKQFYLLSVKENMSSFFPKTMSYPRMVKAMQWIGYTN